MSSGIVINFDYENNDFAVVQAFFEKVKDGMLASGFRQEERLFTIELAADEACYLARLVIDYIDSQQDANSKCIYLYIKEFYGFEMNNITNLMIPANGGIEVQEPEEFRGNEGFILQGYGLAI
jgi:hypothetical protein